MKELVRATPSFSMIVALRGSWALSGARLLSMGVPAYTFVVVCMGALSAAAAIGALALALGQLAPRRKPARKRSASRKPMVFDVPATQAAAPSPLREEPPAAIATPVVMEPLRRLDLALMSRRAPERLRVPVDLTRGRILELNLPLLLANAGEAELRDLTIHLTLPNEITYGASLERLNREGVAGAPGAVVRYVLSEHETRIRFDIPRLEPGAMVSIPAPISIKHAADAAYPIVAIAFAEGLEPLERRYELELMDPNAAIAPVSSRDAWVCRPDESSRQRDPHLPLDRIASMQFVIFEPGESAPALAEPAYEPLTL